MKNIILFIIVLFVLMTSVTAYSHRGRTDGSGGHSCSAKSKKKGLCSGYHQH